jgi:1-acyl-sn-glycerol-3-phosphate acyltransferase
MFPEGEIKEGSDSVLRGGPIKRGVCLLAARSGRPVLPCVILGTDKLNSPDPWLPMLRGRLWVACGEFIEPVTGPDRRAAREEMATRIEKALAALYADLRREYGLEDSIVP